MLKCFYSDLYSKNNKFDSSNYGLFQNSNIPKISYNSVTFCEESISSEEIKKAVKNLKANKSPGTDGLAAEFYQFFFENIKDYLYDSINYSFQNTILSTEQRRGILKLIPKKDKD